MNRIMITWLKQLFCKHEWEEKYCTIDGWAELHYWYKCKKCEKDQIK